MHRSIVLLVICVTGVAVASIVTETCYPDTCADPEMDTFFSYGTCCDNECCYRLRYWVYPASIAGIGFVAGAFFALCFQCR
ncbi:hypothetical protein GCK72_010634 [Caenorhabditis remanei]|uniref:Uncharacterized protein n=1 Tax=Caenorhabditis remanei TaxID=31234 RepID=A0A6A5H7K5_CAERE|nr:hypothetical protein GCK72_010634 [Caenorhabditis remanei]KAF1762372.1 hypothetical protein GCK72_010634 [Caenorhabditis remanei]